MNPHFVEPLETFGWMSENANDQMNGFEDPEFTQINDDSTFAY
jgi:hypothetical protein